MGLHNRVARLATAMRQLDARECPGVGKITELLDAVGPVPPPCRVCGEWHVVLIEEVIVDAHPEATTQG